jgi:dinuclear metal center YbgI/SA1388 family protein
MKPRRRVGLEAATAWCDGVLKPGAHPDWEGAENGLQVENRGWVHRVAATVDARRATVEEAIRLGADLLVVHHGLFWGSSRPWTGPRYQLLRLLLDHDLAVYSAHLPLDEHPRLGNNVLLCQALGFTRLERFFQCKGRPIGFRAVVRLRREVLGQRLARATGVVPLLMRGGPEVCRRVGVVTGGAGAELAAAAAEGVDTFITGEGPHWTHAMADELGVNVFYAGHYATETFGVKALAAAVARRFGIPWCFIDYPTGL